MGKLPITKYELYKRIKERECFLYKLPILATPEYSEDAIDYILENEIDFINGEYLIKDAKEISRKNSYKPKRDKEEIAPKELMASEKWLVKNIFLGKIEDNDVFGELIEYEVPLNNTQRDGAGDIDFISKKDGSLWMVEIKKPQNDKSLLRAVLEIQSYYQFADREKLLSDFGEHFTSEAQIEKIVAIFNDSKEAEQYKNSEKLRGLIKMFNIKVIRLIKYSDDEIFCEEF